MSKRMRLVALILAVIMVIGVLFSAGWTLFGTR